MRLVNHYPKQLKILFVSGVIIHHSSVIIPRIAILLIGVVSRQACVYLSPGSLTADKTRSLFSLWTHVCSRSWRCVLFASHVLLACQPQTASQLTAPIRPRQHCPARQPFTDTSFATMGMEAGRLLLHRGQRQWRGHRFCSVVSFAPARRFGAAGVGAAGGSRATCDIDQPARCRRHQQPPRLAGSVRRRRARRPPPLLPCCAQSRHTAAAPLGCDLSFSGAALADKARPAAACLCRPEYQLSGSSGVSSPRGLAVRRRRRQNFSLPNHLRKRVTLSENI